MNQISTILFDLGNVIGHIDFGAFWRDLGFFQADDMLSFSEGYASLTLQYETGHISTDQYLHGLYTLFNNKYSIEQLEVAVGCIIQKPVEGMANIIQHVSRTHQTALVSNTNEIHYRLSLKKFDVLKILQKHYLSYQIHVMKPARGFYDAIIKDQGIFPSKLLFIDDIAENVKAAKTAGMQIIQFENPERLEIKLKDLGVL